MARVISTRKMAGMYFNRTTDLPDTEGPLKKDLSPQTESPIANFSLAKLALKVIRQFFTTPKFLAIR